MAMPIPFLNCIAYAEVCKHEYSQVLQIPCEGHLNSPKTNQSDSPNLVAPGAKQLSAE